MSGLPPAWLWHSPCSNSDERCYLDINRRGNHFPNMITKLLPLNCSKSRHSVFFMFQNFHHLACLEYNYPFIYMYLPHLCSIFAIASCVSHYFKHDFAFGLSMHITCFLCIHIYYHDLVFRGFIQFALIKRLLPGFVLKQSIHHKKSETAMLVEFKKVLFTCSSE